MAEAGIADGGATVRGSLLRDGFGHHVWATLTLIDACLPLTEAQLTTNAPGTYGPILERVTRQRDDGSRSHAPLGVRLTQAVQHGTDHRSQVATALTSLGIEPPDIDVWAWADSQGCLSEDPAPTS